MIVYSGISLVAGKYQMAVQLRASHRSSHPTLHDGWCIGQGKAFIAPGPWLEHGLVTMRGDGGCTQLPGENGMHGKLGDDRLGVVRAGSDWRTVI